MPHRPLRAVARASWFEVGWVSVAIEDRAHSQKSRCEFRGPTPEVPEGRQVPGRESGAKTVGLADRGTALVGPKAPTCESIQLPRPAV